MKALAGPAMLLVVVGGYAIYKGVAREDAPSRAFTELELAAADGEHTGTCYALDTVLVANGAFGRATRTWAAPEKDNKNKWALTVEAVREGYNGPQHEYQTFTFVRAGDQVRLEAVVGSDGFPTGLAENIDRLLEAPHGIHSTPVDRCRKEHGTGYNFPPK